MDDIVFSWNDKKARQNIIKHRVSFEEASTVFLDENARLIYDPVHSTGEERFILLGLSSQVKFLVVCHCYRKNENVIRIISARKANKQEQKQYGKFYEKRI